MTDDLTQMLRADARDNRDRALGAARELFGERGLGVSMRDVARRAGVGPATLYRRFPTKQALIDEAFVDELRACRAIVRDGCADPDPWRGLRTVIEEITALNARNQGFVDALVAARSDAVDLAAHRAEMLAAVAGLTYRAKDAGMLRADVVVDDLVLVLMAGRGLRAASVRERERAARRLAALAIEAFRAADSNADLPPAPRLVRSVAGRP